MWGDEVKVALKIIKKDLLLARKGKKKLTGRQKRELVEMYNLIRQNAGIIR
ncbi:MAG: hypothetical protein ACFFG0_38220 [Candidatus Thorarchaeota archaeon]